MRPDLRSPFALDTHELGRRAGSMTTVERAVKAPKDLGTEVIGITEGSVLQMHLRLEAVMEGVLVSGTLNGVAAGECVRCLGDVELTLEVPFTELYVYPGQPDVDEEEDVREIVGDVIDLEPAVRDTVVLSLPFQPVCSADCPGLCSTCGMRLADDPQHRHDVADPRWTSLQGLVLDGEPSDEKES